MVVRRVVMPVIGGETGRCPDICSADGADVAADHGFRASGRRLASRTLI
jgi:hypothetical protein